MKSIAVILSLLVCTSTGFAQNTFPASGNAGIGTTTPGTNRLQIVGAVGTNDYIYTAQHSLQIRILNGLGSYGSRALELGLLDNGTSVIQSNECGIGYNALVLNPVWGYVGVGTANPGTRFEVNGAMRSTDEAGLPTTGKGIEISYQTSSDRGRIIAYDRSGSAYKPLNFEASSYYFQNGNVGVGTTNPGSSTKLTVVGSGLFSGTASSDPGDGSPEGTRIGFRADQGYGFVQAMKTGVEYYPLNLNPGGGNVGIGTFNPTEKLSVNGKIRAKEVIVDTNWSDYVFAKDYKLVSLSEVEQHIAQQGHLPGVPSAKEVAEKGVSVGDMQAILLAKIEELTLHQIAQEKKQTAQGQELATQRDQLAAAAAKIDAQQAEIVRLKTK